MDRNEAIARIRAALKKRSGKLWSVRGGSGTAWGWISISAPPARIVDYRMTEADSEELKTLLGLDYAPRQSVSVPASDAYRTEFVNRAETGTTDVIGTPYWD